MKSKRNREKKTLSSMGEFQKEYFPRSWEEKTRVGKDDKVETDGTGLATQLMDSIRRRLCT